MRETFAEAKSIIEDHGYSLEQIREYLDGLRDSGRLNMYGSGDYLMNIWGFTRHEVKPLVIEYVNHGLKEEREADAFSYGLNRNQEEE